MAAKERKDRKKEESKISPHAPAFHRIPSFIPSSSLCSLRSFAAKKSEVTAESPFSMDVIPITHGVFFDLKAVRAEIDEQTVFHPARFQVAQYLSRMFIGQSFAGFQFDDESICEEYIRKVFSNARAVFIKHLDRMLLLHIKASFPEAMSQGIFIDLFQVTMAVIQMDGVRRFAYNVTEFVDRFHSAVEVTISRKGTQGAQKGTSNNVTHAAAFHFTPSFIPSSSLCSLRSFAAKK
jgi:hypothetical protein